MRAARFNIMAALLDGLFFCWNNRRYLAMLALVPLGVELATQALLAAVLGMDAPQSQMLLLKLPADALAGWFMFWQMRLMLFGERLDTLPAEEAAKRQHNRLLTAAVATWLLYKISLMVTTLLLQNIVATGQGEPTPPAALAAIVLCGFVFWSLRFSVAHLVTGSGYPLRQYMRRVRGIGISMRLLALGVLVSLPALFLIQTVLAALPQSMLLAALVASLVSFVMMTVLNAAGVFALREILGGRKP